MHCPLDDAFFYLLMEKSSLKYYILGIGFFFFIVTIIVNGGTNAKWNSIALGGLMVFFWLFEVLPIYITALFPFIFGIPLGVLDKTQLATSYGDSNVYLFLGGFILALALEKHDVHKQIAKRIIKLTGNSKSRVLLGFILSTGILSMWISNTATALMMLPMALAILAAMPKKNRKSKFTLFLLLSIAYSASVGGMATLVGSPPNNAMASILNKAPYNLNVDFLGWMKIGMPLSFIMMFVVFGVFYLLMGKERNEKIELEELAYEPWNKSQVKVIAIFSVVVFLWITKQLFDSYLGFKYDDFGPALLGSLALFIIPEKGRGTLLDWKDTKDLPWGILILFGGGLALAEMFKVNGIITDVSNMFMQYTSLGLFLILLLVISVAIFATELMSNLALVTVFIPVIAEFALQSDYSIVQLCVPVTLAASCAFMLPVGTPPNAIVFSSGEIKINQMARYGFLLNVLAVAIITLFATLFYY